jgi:hypothetical protein
MSRETLDLDLPEDPTAFLAELAAEVAASGAPTTTGAAGSLPCRSCTA